MTIQPLIAGNWKMNKTPSEAAAWARDFVTALEKQAHDHAEVLICAPFTHLASLVDAFEGSAVGVGAQDVSAHAEGAYTGEVSAAMLQDLGVRYAIIGHSERREYHQEDDELVNAKIKSAQKHALHPILCIGETLEQREAGRAVEVVLEQFRGGLEGIELEQADALVIAYEPVWAIGTGRTATAEDAQEICGTIRGALKERFPQLGEQVRILYGGSMKPGNAAELFAQPDINGGLIGGASLDIASLLAIVEAARA
jgi:triosephosphate isomerase